MVSNVFLQWAAGESCACQFTGTFCFLAIVYFFRVLHVFLHILLLVCFVYFAFNFASLQLAFSFCMFSNLLFHLQCFPIYFFVCNVCTSCVFSAIFCSLPMSKTSKPEMWSLVKKGRKWHCFIFAKKRS